MDKALEVVWLSVVYSAGIGLVWCTVPELAYRELTTLRKDLSFNGHVHIEV